MGSGGRCPGFGAAGPCLCCWGEQNPTQLCQPASPSEVAPPFCSLLGSQKLFAIWHLFNSLSHSVHVFSCHNQNGFSFLGCTVEVRSIPCPRRWDGALPAWDRAARVCDVLRQQELWVALLPHRWWNYFLFFGALWTKAVADRDWFAGINVASSECFFLYLWDDVSLICRGCGWTSGQLCRRSCRLIRRRGPLNCCCSCGLGTRALLPGCEVSEWLSWLL